MKKYTIKPLKWEHVKRDDYECWSAHPGILGSLYVNTDSPLSSSSWQFQWCVDEYYDEGREYFDTAEEAKARAEAWYLERLTVALEEVITPARSGKDEE